MVGVLDLLHSSKEYLLFSGRQYKIVICYRHAIIENIKEVTKY